MSTAGASTTQQASAKPTPQPSAPVHSNLLQLKCACGGTAGVDGMCGGCREKQLQRNAFGDVDQNRAPRGERDALRSPGEPPDPESRAVMGLRLGHDFSRIHVHSSAPAGVQPKLRVSTPNDRYEQEANRVAAQVIPTPAPSLQRQPALDRDEAQLQTETPAGRITPLVQRDGMLRPNGSASPSLASFEELVNSRKGGGSPLPPGVRHEMEPRFGADFGAVRIHTDDEAARMSQELNAHAFTHGSNIYFNSGRFDAESRAGRMLLAHELTHTIQQGAAPRAAARISALQQRALDLQGQAHALHVGIADIDAGQTPVGIQKLDLGFPLDVGRLLSDVGGSLPDVGGLLSDVGETLADVGGLLPDMADLLGESIPNDPIEAIEMILAALENPLVQPIVSAIPGLVAAKAALQSALKVLKLIRYVIDNMDQIIEEIMGFIEARLEEVAPIVESKLREALGFLDPRHYAVIWGYVVEGLRSLRNKWREIVMTTLNEQIKPWKDIEKSREVGEIRESLSSGFHNLLDANFSQALDDFLMIAKSIVGLANRFAGWASVLIVASETLYGAVTGGIAGAAAGGAGAVPGAVVGAGVGFGAGLVTAGTVGEALLFANLGVEAAVLNKSIYSLEDFDRSLKDEEKARRNDAYYRRIAESGIAIGVMGALFMLSWVGGVIAKNFQNLVKNVFQALPRDLQAVLRQIAEPIKRGMEPIKRGMEPIKRGMKGEKPAGVVRNARKAPPQEPPTTAPPQESPTTAPPQEPPTTAPTVAIPRNIKVGDPVTVPYGGSQVRGKVVGVDDKFVTIEFPVRQGQHGNVKQSIPRDRFKQMLADREAIHWTAERQRLMRTRPKYAEGQVEKVWNRAKQPDGKVYDPTTGRELTWDPSPSKNRYDQWHMGHNPEHEYSKLVDDLVEGRKTWEEFMKEYHNPDNYWPEDPIENMRRSRSKEPPPQ